MKDDTEPNITRFATYEKNHSRRSHEEVPTKERKVLDIGASARAPAKDETERRRLDRFLPVMNITEHPHWPSDWGSFLSLLDLGS